MNKAIQLTYTWFYSLAPQPSAGYGLLVYEVFVITHNDATHSVVLLWTSDQIVPDTSTWQHTTHTPQTNIPATAGIRTHDRRRRVAVDLRLRPRGHWDRHFHMIKKVIFLFCCCNLLLLSVRILHNSIFIKHLSCPFHPARADRFCKILVTFPAS
jgi:hypothetical protein